NGNAGSPNASGTLTVNDVDSGQAVFQTVAPAALAGTYGNFTFNNNTGAWTYALDNTKSTTQELIANQVVHDTLTVKSADGTATQVIDVTVTGSNDNATITGTATGAVTEAGGVNNGNAGSPNASGMLTANDVDSGQAVFQAVAPAALAGTYGNFTFNSNTGAWTYVLDNTKSTTQELIANQVVHDTLTVKSADGTATQVIDVTVTGSNDSPVVVVGGNNGSVTEAGNQDDGTVVAGTASATGTLTSMDVDAGATATWSGSAAGSYGSFAIGADGSWTYTLDNTPGGAADQLAEGDVKTETFTATVTDDKGATATATVTITVTGSNDSPAITSSAQGGSVKEDTTLTATGQVTSNDVDHGATAAYSGDATGVYGSFAVNAATGAWTYTLDNANHQDLAAGESHTETFTVTVTDDKGATATQDVVITVTGTNDDPTVTAGVQSVPLVEAGVGTTGTANASITLTKGDFDTGDAASYDGAALTSDGWATGDGGVTYTKTGTYGTATLTTASGVVSYALDNNDTDTNALAGGASVSDNFTIFVKDGSTGTASTAVNFAITGSNDNPTVTAGAQSVPLVEAGVGTGGTASATIALTKADPDTGDAASYDGAALTSDGWATGDGGATYTKTGTYGTATLTTASGVVSYALDNNDTDTNALAGGASVSDDFTVFVKDGSTGTASTAVNFAITGSNDNPTVSAGAQSVPLVEAGVGTAGTANASIALTKGDFDTGDAASYDGAALTSDGWATGDGGATYTKTGTYGTATLTTASGVVSYALDNNDTDTNALAGGASVSDDFTVFVKDGSTGTASTAVNFAITGSNDNPMVTAGAQSVPLVEAGVGTTGTANASIALTKGDFDTGDAASYDGAALTSDGWATGDGGATYTKTGTYGTATLTTATGVVSYALDNNDTDSNALAGGASVSDDFTVFVKDGSTGTASTAVNFAITGSNDNPTVTAGAQSVPLVEAGVGTAGTANASIALTKGDFDTGDAASYDGAALTSDGWATGDGGVTYTKTGTYGTATLTTASGVVSYALDNNDTDSNALAGG
ncbi:beta strand repeat-containing protein, partial [Bradyrhizobium liaoningense]|uniref:beta strand repeat-containing protein n=1 Tax=Bradyrhizobium liaoningense TaxID=43992 RepID=UPI001BA7E407